MTWTWGGIVNLALFRSGLVGAGQVPKPSETAQGFDALELLLDEWNGIGLSLPDYPTDMNFFTVSNQFKYWLGTGSESAALTVRPEQIITAQVQVSTTDQELPVWLTLVPIDFRDYQKIPVPSTQAQPINYAINQKWPQMELYLYPNPNEIYQIRLTCKVPWAATVKDPACAPCSDAQLASGYTTALVDNLALKIAENNRLQTDTLMRKAYNGRFTVAQYVASQVRDMDGVGADAFSWNIIRAGSNP